MGLAPDRRGERSTARRGVRRRPSRDVPLVEVELLAAPGGHWTSDVTARWPIRIQFRTCRPFARGRTGMLQVVELAGSPADLAAAEEFLRTRSDLSALTILPLSPTRRFVRAVGPLPAPCERVFEAGAICASCRFLPSPTGRRQDRWSLIVPRAGSSRLTRRGLAGLGRVEAPVVGVRPFVPPRSLTPRQAAALETAYRLGYFGFPRRTNLAEVARILGVRRATASELLRRAEEKMLAPELSER